MNFADLFMLARCIWTEARGEGTPGMVAVGCVIRNRVHKRGTDFYTEVTRRAQFTSITVNGDPNSAVYPASADGLWKSCCLLADGIAGGTIKDTTQGSTMYFSPSAMSARDIDPKPIVINGVERVFPRGWDRNKVNFQCQIGKQLFFTERN